MAKAKKSIVEQYELKPAAAIILVAATLSYIWWQLLEANMLDNFPWLPRAITLAVAGIVLFILQSGRFSTKKQSNLLRILTHVSALTIGFVIFWDWWNWKFLDINWYNLRTFYTGQAAICFIILGLACTPLNTLFGWSALISLKKPLGNYAFLFAAVHLMLFVFEKSLVDGFQIQYAIEEAILKRYALVGFVAFLLLIPLFLTSNKWSQKRLGKRWKKLHSLVYLIAVLAATHYIWVWMSKRALAKPIIFAVIVAFLLFLRLDVVKKKIREFKKQRRLARRAAT